MRVRVRAHCRDIQGEVESATVECPLQFWMLFAAFGGANCSMLAQQEANFQF